MRNRIKQFFGWMWQGIKSLWQIGWKKIFDFVTNCSEVGELLDKMEDSAYVSTTSEHVNKLSVVKSCCQSFWRKLFKKDVKRYEPLIIDIPKHWVRGKTRALSPLEKLVL